MVFEGSEKKFECTSYNVNFRAFGTEFFQQLVERSNASILKKSSNDYCDCYLLSESSLFVWQDRILMITCGNTTLMDSLIFLIDKIQAENIDSLIFQRKNEHFSELQVSNFEQDVETINSILSGNILRLGAQIDHHNLIYSLNKKMPSRDNDHTFEMFNYGISDESSAFLTRKSLSSLEIRHFFKLGKLLEGFDISDFVFKPCGYSLNAINNKTYCTLHVTPQKDFSYVSFETNMKLDRDLIANHLIEILHPESVDIISFNLNHKTYQHLEYTTKEQVSTTLECGYQVVFQHLNKRKL